MRATIAVLVAILAGSCPARAIPIPPEVTKVVAFVYVPAPGTGAPVPAGSCFLVGVAVPGNAQRSWVYAVTNKHVLTSDATKSWFPYIWLRFNTRGGGSQLTRIPLETSLVRETLFPSHDPAVDLALVAVGDISHFDALFLPIPELTAATDMNQMNIAPGTDLFFSGMFSEYQGSSRMEPIVRFGRVAMVPQGPVPFKGVAEELILADVFSFGGNSGSPVFYYQGADRTFGSLVVGTPVIKLAGVMQGFFAGNEPALGRAVASGDATNNNAPIVRKPRSAKTTPPGSIPVFLPNSGIAAIIPAQKILDILDYTELKLQQR